MNCPMLESYSRFWHEAFKAALQDVPIGPGIPCHKCGIIHSGTRKEILDLEQSRNQYLQVCRSDPHAPTKEQVRLICLWIMKQGYDVPAYWKHWSNLQEVLQ